MQVLFIITSLSTGGAEISLKKLVLGMPPEEVQIISLTTCGEIGKELLDAGYRVEALGLVSSRHFIGAFLQLVRLIRASAPDIVSTWLYHADLIGGLAARLAGTRAIVWGIRNGALPKETTKRGTRLIARLCAMLSRKIPVAIISCSRKAREIHVALGYAADRFAVIPNGFDLRYFQPEPESRAAFRGDLALPLDAEIIGMIARDDPIKNHRGFLEAAELLVQRRPCVHFVLIGQGMDSKNTWLTDLISHHHLEERVHLLGLRRDTAALYPAFDLATLTSWSEAFPTVIGEAMACGIPCVVTDVGDAAWIVGDTGMTVPAGDTQRLAQAWEAILSLDNEAKKHLGNKARERIASQFELSATQRKFRALFAEVAGHAFSGWE